MSPERKSLSDYKVRKNFIYPTSAITILLRHTFTPRRGCAPSSPGIGSIIARDIRHLHPTPSRSPDGMKKGIPAGVGSGRDRCQVTRRNLPCRSQSYSLWRGNFLQAISAPPPIPIRCRPCHYTGCTSALRRRAKGWASPHWLRPGFRLRARRGIVWQGLWWMG